MKNVRYVPVVAPLSAVIFSILLSACGGGGGTKETPPVSTPVEPTVPVPPPVAPVTTPKFQADNHLSYSNVGAAHAAGYTGKGQIIGVVDSGVNENAPSLQGKIVKAVAFSGNGMNGSTPVTNSYSSGHGTEVSQIIAGSAVNGFAGGVAPDAGIVMARVSTDKNEVAYTTQSIDFMRQSGVRIVNNSWNVLFSNQPIENTNTMKTFATTARAFIEDNDGLLIFANGNEMTANPGQMSVIPLFNPDLEKGWLTVGSVSMRNGALSLSTYSDACGVAANWCLVAVGDIGVLNADTFAYKTNSGTSFAAPQVTAAAALVAQAFPWMSNDQIRTTLLGTATDMGAKGVDNIYGYGLLNTGAAVHGPRDLNWGVQNFDVDQGAYTFSNNLSGAGGVAKSGAGELYLSGTNTYTGGTQIHDGVLGVSGHTTSDITVAKKGTLNVSGRISGTVSNSGRIVANGGVIDGNVVQNSSAALDVSLGNPFVVDGEFAADGSLNVVGVNTGFVAVGQHSLVQATSVTGEFDTLNIAPSLFLSGTVSYTNNEVVGQFQQIKFGSLAALTSTASATAATDVVDRAIELGNTLAQDTSKDRVAFLNELGRFQSIQDTNVALMAIEQSSGQQHALLAASVIETQNQADQLNRARLRTVAEMDSGVWINGAALNNTFSPSGWNGVDSTAWGWTVGADFWVSDNLMVGVYGMDGRIDSKIDGRLGRSKIDQHGGGVYAALAFGAENAWNISASVSMNDGHSRSTRPIAQIQNFAAVGERSVEGRQDFRQTSSNVELAYNMGSVQVFGALGYQTFKWDALHEDNAPLGLIVDGTKTHTTFAELGVETRNTFHTDGAWNWMWNARGSISHNISQPSLDMTAAFVVDPNNTFVIDAPELDRTRLNYGVGVSGAYRSWNVFVEASGVYSEHSHGIGANAGVKYAW